MSKRIYLNPETFLHAIEREKKILFSTREIDYNVLRPYLGKSTSRSEAAQRAAVREKIRVCRLKVKAATDSEVRQLQALNIIGVNAYRTSLLTAEDAIKLLWFSDLKVHAAHLQSELKQKQTQTQLVPLKKKVKKITFKKAALTERIQKDERFKTLTLSLCMEN